MDIGRVILFGGISFLLVGGAVFCSLLLPQSLLQWFSRSRNTLHTDIPRIGGILIIPIVISMLFLLHNTGSFGDTLPITSVIWGALGVLFYGIWDEKYDLSWKMQLTIQIIIALILVVGGVTISGIMIPFFGLWDLETLSWSVFMRLDIYPLSAFVTILWVVGLMNVVNWLDGLDGLASGIGVIAFVTLIILALTPFVGQYHIAVIGSILAGSYLGVLWFNWRPAEIFLGTTGSMFLGYMLAVLSLMSGGKIGTSALVFAVPIIDAIIVLVRRFFAGQSIFKSDRRHLHYQLLTLGWTEGQVVMFLYSMSVFFGVCALAFGTVGKFGVFIGGLTLLIIITLWITSQQQSSFEQSKNMVQ